MPERNCDRPARGHVHIARLFSVIVLIGASSANTLAQDAIEDFDYATNLYKKGRYEQAETAFRTFLSTYRDNSRASTALLYYGHTLSNLGRYREARDQFSEFTSKYPENRNIADASYRVGECSYYARDYKVAEKQLREFRIKYPDHSLVDWAFLFEGQSQLALKEWVTAQGTFQALLKREPKMIRDVEYGMGRSLEGQGKIAEAFNYYGKLAKTKDPVVSPRSLSRMGSLYFKAGELKRAIDVYGMVVRDYEKNTLAAPAKLNIGLAYFRQKDYPTSIEWLKKAKADKANRPRADILHAISLQKTSAYEEADKALTALLSEFPNNNQFTPEILYYRADGLRLSGRPDEARKIFESVSNDWSRSSFADDALYFAADSAMQAKAWPEARKLLDALDERFPDHTYKPQAKLIRGRIAAKGTDDKELRLAVTELRTALADASDDRTRSLTRYYLARTYQQLREHKEVIDVAKPVLSEIDAGQNKDLAGLVVLAAVSELALGQNAAASKTASRYIAQFPTGEKIVDAREVKAIAEANQNNWAAVDAELKAIELVDNQRVATVVKRLANVAWQRGKFDRSRDLYRKLTFNKTSPLRPEGLSGLGWSLYELKSYRESAMAFQQLVDEYPDHERVPEARFKIGDAHRDAGDPGNAIAAYRVAFDKYLPAEAAPAQAEFRKPILYSFEAGLQLAELLELQGRVEEADKVFERLTTTFPKAAKLDRIIERWAYMHQDADNIPRADELLQSLIDKCPDSERIYDARLFLAESQMMRGKTDSAVKEFQALRDNPKSPRVTIEGAIYNLASIANLNEDNAAVKKHTSDYLSNYQNGAYSDHIRFFRAETLYRENDLEQANQLLTELRAKVLAPGAKPQDWHGLIWVDLAEIRFAQKQYDKVGELAREMLTRPSAKTFYYRMHEVVGKSHYKQANFDAARESFRKVILDGYGRRTPTAGNCQLRLGDSWMAQEKYSNALTEFMKAYLNYGGLKDIQAAGLFQAAGCEEKLKRPTPAMKSYQDLIKEFPNTEWATKAQTQLDKLKSAARP